MKKKTTAPPMTPDDVLLPPGPLLLALEGRMFWEFGASIAAFPLLRGSPSGDGHSVLVFPGLAASDISTLPLRAFLRERGYGAHGWNLRLNLGPRKGVLDQSVERVRALRKSSGRRVSLIGWSLGGIYAREIAKLLPDDVRCVVTLGTPFTGSPKATNAWRIYEMASGHKLDDPKVLAQVREAPPVPTTSIYSRTDGVVAWQCSVQRPGKRTENVELSASHIGMGVNPFAWYVLADRLAQAEGRWQPFHREGWRRWIYPEPEGA